MRSHGRTALIAIGAIVATILGTFALLIIGGVISVGGNEINARIQEAQQGSRARAIIADPKRLIAEYDYFFNTCNAVVAYSKQIKTAEETLAQMKKDYDPAADRFGTGQEAIQQQQTVVQGLKNQRDAVAAEYNAAAAANKTRGKFRDVNLPERIDNYDGLFCS